METQPSTPIGSPRTTRPFARRSAPWREDKIAPYAAAVDEEARYPQEAHDALVAADFHAPHVPEEYDGVGADALATCIVIEEVARVLRLRLADPRREQARHLPLLLAGSEAQAEVPPSCGSWRGRRSPTGCPSARPAPTPQR